MRPLTVITGVILGSCLSIAVSLAMVLIVVLIIGDESPRLEREFTPLLRSLLIFVGMTVIGAGSFYALLRRHRLRLVAQLVLWLGVVATGWYYWP